ncbi:peptidoglycan DD-metalloendopeptidase family protein [Pokkaliibacter sp. CJK22405]|uniref:peptidoglycan DD-metalloendopeptidase family protein n=1 Tax=Pokkaliibacter sp. CJK22405 TaxID=3384615 RepID=UPI003985380F
MRLHQRYLRPLRLLILCLPLFLAACGSNPPLPTNTGYYYVVSGDTFYSIARRYGTTVKILSRLNPSVTPSRIEVGQRLVVPGEEVIGNFSFPVRHVEVSSPFGERNGRMHKGVDFRSPSGAPILAAADGRVSFSGSMRGYGRLVIIDHANDVQTVYAHNSANLVHKGETVVRGQTVARIGSTGNSSGNHVHFELRIHGRAVNPMSYLK